MSETDYRTVFEEVEATLLRLGGHDIRQRLDEFKMLEQKRFSDSDYFDTLIMVVFYSGMNADTVTKKKPTILRYLSDYKAVAKYDGNKVSDICGKYGDPEMLRNSNKVLACVSNARAFEEIVGQYGSFESYINTFSPRQSNDNLMALRTALMRNFFYLGKITSYHFLTDIGMPVLKPDRVIMRIFSRLGLITSSEDESEEGLAKVVGEGRKFAVATGHPIRYIDIVFVAYGQMASSDFGIQRGVCLENVPRCDLCGATKHCKYFIDRQRS